MNRLRTETLAPCAGRTLVLADVHGCADEMEALIAEFSPRPADRILSVGDLVNRGPDSPRVLGLARRHGIRAVLGNHEERLLRAWRSGQPAGLKAKDLPTFRQLGREDFQWMESWPHVLELPELGMIVVHGGFAPGTAWRGQDPFTATRIQVLDSLDRPARRADCPSGRPWADRWQGPEHVIYGHTPRPHPLLHARATGIDTGCVYGYSLTGLVLPEFRFIRVPAALP